MIKYCFQKMYLFDTRKNYQNNHETETDGYNHQNKKWYHNVEKKSLS